MTKVNVYHSIKPKDLRKSYRKKKQYEEQLINKLEYLYTNNKSEFWKFLKSMKNQKKNEDLPQLHTMIDNFKNLFCQQTDDNVIQNIENTSNEQNKHFDILNTPINQKEVEEGIRNLKLKKSPGFDCVTNEMLNCTNSHGKSFLSMLFNKVLKSGIFPCEWNYGMIKLINKEWMYMIQMIIEELSLIAAWVNYFVQYYIIVLPLY